MSFVFHWPLSCLSTINTVTGGLTNHSFLWHSHCVIIIAAALKHFEIPANTEGVSEQKDGQKETGQKETGQKETRQKETGQKVLLVGQKDFILKFFCLWT